MKSECSPILSLLATCSLALALLAGKTQAQPNLVLLVSHSGDYIGAGQTYVTTNLSDFSVALDTWGLDVSAFGFDIWADGPNGAPLAVGDYPGAARDPFNGGAPGLSIFGNGRGCNTVCGSFHIYELATDAGGNPAHLWMTFTQYCECIDAPLVGDIRYHSQLAPPAPAARTLLVPAQYPTIQAAIDDASLLSRDTVLVSNGVYHENLDFEGKAMAVTSVNGPEVTFIDGGQTAAVVNMGSGETTNALLAGFTLTNGSAGVSVSYSSPTINSNVIVNCGTGVYCTGASPLIFDNYITGSAGTAIYFGGGNNPVLQGNTLVTNQGGGVNLGYGVSPLISDNLIQGNGGEGITMFNGPNPIIVQNIIVANSGNGISADISWGSTGPYAINNTIADNGGAGVSLGGFDSGAYLGNNIISGTPALNIGTYGGSAPPPIQANDIYSPDGPLFAGGAITNLSQIPGNLSVDPDFACEPGSDFHLLSGSPCIDAGTNSAPDLPTTDFDGNPRIVAGNSNGAPVIDQGAYEFNPLNPPVPCLYINCETDLVVYAAAGQSPVVVNYPKPAATPEATVVCSPPSGAGFYAGTNLVTCTATLGTNSATCTFNIIVIAAPAITRPPQDVAVAAGRNATLAVTVSGSAPFGYVWSYQGRVLYGQNNSTLTITNAQAANDGVYSVLIYNDAGSTNSRLARVRVLPAPPAIVVNPKPDTVTAGSTAAFSVIAVGSEPMLYQWYHSGRAVQGATNATLAVPNAQVANAGTYFVTVSNPDGTTASKSVALTVKPLPPVFIAGPESTEVTAGSAVVFSSQVVGSAPIQFQWYFQSRPLVRATASSLQLSNVTSAQAGSYYVVARNSSGTARSATATLTVDVPPQPVRRLTSQIVKPGQRVVLTFAASGGAPLAYGWQFNGLPIADTNAVLVLSNIQPAQAGYYSVTATNEFGSSSSTAKITMFGTPGRLVAWGDNSARQTNVPAALGEVLAAAGGDYHTLALRTNCTVAAWGDNSSGQTSIPAMLPGIVAIAAGANHNLAIGFDGSLHAWGDDTWGQCDFPAAATNEPLAVAAGDAHSLELSANGVVNAWGDDTYNQIDLPNVLTPYLYYWWGFGPNPNPEWRPALAIAAGRNHSLAILTNETVVAWGDDSGGQCDVPSDLTNVVAVAGGYLHSLALRADGTVVAWGDDTYGQMEVPPGLTNVVAVAAGDFDSLALLANGHVVGWGDDTYGEIDIPISATNAVAIASGYYHSLAVVPPAAKPTPAKRSR